jgi:uncharacterized protein YkwD
MTDSPLLRHLPLFIILAQTPLAAAADVVSSVNKVRAHGCPGGAGGQVPLQANRQLDAIARQLQGGANLLRAEKEAHYLAIDSVTLEIPGALDDGYLDRVLNKQFCSAATGPQFREIGVYSRGAAVWIVLAQPFTPPAIRDASAISRRVLELTNSARSHARRCGGTLFPPAPPLTSNVALERAALEHSRDMATHNYMDHRGRDGSRPEDRITRAGYKWRAMGENLAEGVTTAEEAVDVWLQSPHHCANLMDRSFTQTGIAFETNPKTDKGVYWTQTFGAPLR